MMHRVWAILIVLSWVVPAWGWCNKEHIQLTRMAAEALLADDATPTAMKAFLRAGLPRINDEAGEKDYFLNGRVGLVPRGVEGLTYWAVMPDMTKMLDRDGQNIAPFGASEQALHYIDLEMFMPDAAKRSYADDLSHKPRLADIPRDMNDPRWRQSGLLPFRVEDCYHKMVADLHAGLLDDQPGRFPRDEHAVHWAGYLAHYVEDNTQPQHATIDYKSHFYFADQRKAPNVHWDVEGRLLDDEYDDYMDLRREFWPIFIQTLAQFKDPVKTADPWQSTVEVSLASYDALPLIGQAAMAAYGQAGTPASPQGPAGAFDAGKFFHFRGTYMGRDMTVMEMKAYQMAWAVKRVERLWLAAWNEGQAK